MKDYSSIYYDDNIVISGQSNNKSIESAMIINAIKIDNEAFYNNENLKGVLFGDNLISIGNDAFNGCHMLRYRLPSNVKYLGKRAFANIRSNINLVIPSTIRKIGIDCFMFSKLNTVYVEEGVTVLLDIFRGSSINELYLPRTIQYVDINNYKACKRVSCYRESSVFEKCFANCKDKIIIRGDI